MPAAGLTKSPRTPRRRTQAERTATTCARLLDATIDCLLDVGYARTTTTDIARRAGVSRGAQLHHFPTKAELVTAAVEHLSMRRHAEFVRAIGKLPAGEGRTVAAIDLLWSILSSGTFYAWLELLVASRTDVGLRRSMTAVTERFSQTVERTFAELIEDPRGPSPLSDVAPFFAFALLDGLALHRIVQADDGRSARSIDVLKSLARLVMPGRKEAHDGH